MKCGFETTAENNEALLVKVKEHARTAHSMARIDEATMAKITAAMTEA
jgi:predicted small metal-binding protein